MTLPTILGPGEGNGVDIGTDARCTFKLTGEESGGHFGLFEWTMAPGAFGPRPHIHKEMEEMFYVIEGEVDLIIGDRTIRAGKGTFVRVPRRTAHGFSNPSQAQATMLIIFCPADHREKYFEGLAELTKGGRRPDPDALVKLMKRFDSYPVVK